MCWTCSHIRLNCDGGVAVPFLQAARENTLHLPTPRAPPCRFLGWAGRRHALRLLGLTALRFRLPALGVARLLHVARTRTLLWMGLLDGGMQAKRGPCCILASNANLHRPLELNWHAPAGVRHLLVCQGVLTRHRCAGLVRLARCPALSR